MFWGKKKTDDDKEKHIKQLKQAFPSLRRPNNDDTLFEIRFTSPDGLSNSLRVFIPSDFPLIRPVLQVAGPMNHPWLDQFKQVNGSQKLMNWNKNSLLIEVVEESLSALMTGVNGGSKASVPTAQTVPDRTSLTGAQNVPTAYAAPTASQYSAVNHSPSSNNTQGSSMAVVYPATNSNTNPPSRNGSLAQPSPGTSPVIANPNKLPAHSPAVDNPVSPIALPEIPRHFPELEEMSIIQLERLLNDPVALEAHAKKNVPSLELMRSMLEDLRRDNLNSASSNVLLQDELTQLHNAATEMKRKLIVAGAEYEQEYKAYKEYLAKQPELIIQEVQKKMQQIDTATEAMGEKLSRGDIELNAFLQSYLEERTKYHLLSTKTKANIIRL